MQPVIQHRPPTIKLIIVRSWVRIGVSGFMGGLATRAASTLLLCKAPFRCETPFRKQPRPATRSPPPYPPRGRSLQAENAVWKSRPGGKSAGNFSARSAETLNPLRNSTELDACPGYQVR